MPPSRKAPLDPSDNSKGHKSVASKTTEMNFGKPSLHLSHHNSKRCKWSSKVARILDDPSNIRQLSADLKDNIKSRQSVTSETPEKNFGKPLYTLSITLKVPRFSVQFPDPPPHQVHQVPQVPQCSKGTSRPLG